MIKIIHRYFRGRWERFYLKSHWHLILDLSLFLIILILLAAVFISYLYRPNFSWLGYVYQPTVDLNNPPLELNFSAATSTIKIEEGAVLKLNFKNNSLTVINNLIIDLSAGDNNFTLDKLELGENNSNGTIQGRALIFSRLAPKASGELEFKMYFKPKDSKERVINWQARNEYSFGGRIIKSVNILPPLTLAADLIVKNLAYYTSPQGDQLGVGPLPPIVGLPTSYWIFWEAKSTYDFKDLVFSARLPKGVELTSSRSLLSGEFNYSSSSRQIIWKVSNLKGHDDSYRLSFEVKLIPLADQIGRPLTLLNDFRYHAIDAFTAEEINQTLPALDTNLEFDRFNSGQGRVIVQ